MINHVLGSSGYHEFSYNTSFQSALQATPFEVVYGRPPLPLASYLPGSTQVVAVDQQLRDHDEFLAEIQDRLRLAHDVMKEHQHKRCLVEFAVGDWVLLRLHHRTLASLLLRRPSSGLVSSDHIMCLSALGRWHTACASLPRRVFTMFSMLLS